MVEKNLFADYGVIKAEKTEKQTNKDLVYMFLLGGFLVSARKEMVEIGKQYGGKNMTGFQTKFLLWVKESNLYKYFIMNYNRR